MQFLTPAEILTLLAIGVCLLAGVWAVASSLGRGRGAIGRGARQAAAHGQAACGRCGHFVDPQSTTCPECGTPHAIAGTATPALLARSGAPAWLAAILLAVPALMAALVLYGVAYRAIPMVVTPAPPSTTHRTLTLDLSPTRNVAGGPPYTLTYGLDVHGHERRTGVPPRETLAFDPDRGDGRLWAFGGSTPRTLLLHDFATGGWTLEDHGGAAPTPVTTGSGLEAGVAALFAHAGLDQRPFADAERYEAVAWFTHLHGPSPPNGFLAVGPAGESSGGYDTALWPTGRRNSSMHYGAPAAATWTPSPLARPLGLAAGAVPLLAWLIAIALLARSRRRVMRG
jgi:hypothetical protein